MAYAAVVVLGSYVLVAQQSQGDPLLRGFQNPPDSAKPRVWWHWMSGNVTKDGIKADLEWMKRVRHRRLPELRRRPEHAADRREAAGLHDAGVEGRLQVRHHAGRPAGPRNGDRRLAGMERKRRAVGHARAGDEEVRVERDPRRRRTSVHRRAAEASLDDRPVSEPGRRARWIRRPGRDASRRRPSSTRTRPSSRIARRRATVR